MKTPIRVNIIVFAMLFVCGAFLLLKGNLGLEEDRENALGVLLYLIPIAGLFSAWPFLEQVFKPVAAEPGHRRLLNDKLILPLLLCGILAIDLFYIGTYRVLLRDEVQLLNAVKLYVDQGQDYFFNHYAQIPWLGNQHPPLPVLIIAFVVDLFESDIYFPARITSTILGLGTALCTYLIAKQLYDRKVALFSMILLLAMRSFNVAMLSSNNDIFVVFFFTLTVLLVLKLKDTEEDTFVRRAGLAVVAGISLGLGLLSKYTMFFAYLMLLPLLYRPFTKWHINTRMWYKKRADLGLALLTVLVSLLVFSVWLDYLFRSGVINVQASVLLHYMGADTEPKVPDEIQLIEYGYFSEWRLKFTLKALAYRIWSGTGIYNLPLMGLGIWAWIRQDKRGEKVEENRFIGYWLAIIFIPVLMALPVNRYFLPAYPALAILMANGLNVFCEKPARVLVLALLLSYTMAIIYLS